MSKPQNTRSRKLPGHTAWATLTVSYRGNPPFQNSKTGYVPVGVGKQMTASEGHHWPPPKGADLSDRGGDFFTEKSYIASAPPKTLQLRHYDPVDQYTYTHTGTWYPHEPVAPGGGWAFPPSGRSSNDDLDEKGATAIARCKPTNSPADVSTFLAELLKDGIPNLIGSTIWKSKTESALKKSASEYLNVQFGWAPVLNEVSKFAETMQKADKILTQYERDAGRVVRRRYDFPLEKKVEEWQVKTNASAVTPNLSNTATQRSPLGTVSLRRETLKRQWFTGAFTYALPSGYDSRKQLASLAAKADVLFGTSLTPETIWNAAPWSWAIDWFSNTGDVISNITDFANQGLVMRYGYMMEHTIVKDTYTLSRSGRVNPLAGMQPLVLVTETKVRRRANPFGFGVSWDGLSSFQASILGALGITRFGR